MSQILYLAGREGGVSPIDEGFKRRAEESQKHTITNAINSLTGIYYGYKWATLGTLFMLPWRATLGGQDSVCKACASSINYLVQTYFGTAVSDYIPLEGTCWRFVDAEDYCRMLNFAAGYLEITLSDGFFLVTAVLAAKFARDVFYEAGNKEVRSEKELMTSLEDRFKAIAHDLQVSEKVEEVAQEILGRKEEHEEMILSLKLPSLTKNRVQKILSPVYQVAQSVCKATHGVPGGEDDGPLR